MSDTAIGLTIIAAMLYVGGAQSSSAPSFTPQVNSVQTIPVTPKKGQR